MACLRKFVLPAHGIHKAFLRTTTVRSLSTGGNVSINMDDKTGVATMTMKKKPVNSLDLSFLTELCISLDKLEADSSCKGLILTSDVRNIFSAGLDIMTMYQPSAEHLREFWRTLQDVWIKLYGSRLATIAALNGNTIAGGCLLALSCDVRFMADGPYSIGLNETLLGIVAPFWFQQLMQRTVGYRQAESAMMLGKLFKAPDALHIGLVDEIVPAEQLQQRAIDEMKTWLAIPEGARIITKQMNRQPLINDLIKKKDEDIDNFVTYIMTDAVQANLEKYLNMLKAKKK